MKTPRQDFKRIRADLSPSRTGEHETDHTNEHQRDQKLHETPPSQDPPHAASALGMPGACLLPFSVFAFFDLPFFVLGFFLSSVSLTSPPVSRPPERRRYPGRDTSHSTESRRSVRSPASSIRSLRIPPVTAAGLADHH